MGREVRMVPKGWNHPAEFVQGLRGRELRYRPLLARSYAESAKEYEEEKSKWERGEFPSYASEENRKLSYEEWNREAPHEEDFMPDFPPGAATMLVMYENTSEGTPISPAFATPEELARWLADNDASAFGSSTATYEQWLATCKSGWAPSAVYVGDSIISDNIKITRKGVIMRLITIAATLILTACGAGTSAIDAPAAPQKQTASLVRQSAPTLPPPGMEYSAYGITIRTCDHDANTICSFKRGGVEHIDDYDHGRQLQSDVSYDNLGENFNPTEAGASIFTDGINPHPSSSYPIAAKVSGGELRTTTQMAYWNPVNGQRLSNETVAKTVRILSANVISYQVRFARPAGETHTWGQYEALTGYMPGTFSSFYRVVGGVAQSLSDGPGEQQYPVILCRPAGDYCMGVYSPQLPQPQWANEAGYGRWRHTAHGVVKWNAVFRGANPAAYQAFQLYVVVGTLAESVAAVVNLQNGVVP